MSTKQKHEAVHPVAVQTLVLLNSIDTPQAEHLVSELNKAMESASKSVALFDVATIHVALAEAASAATATALKLMVKAAVASGSAFGSEAVQPIFEANFGDWFGVSRLLAEELRRQSSTHSFAAGLEAIREKAESTQGIAIAEQGRWQSAVDEMTQQVLLLESTLYATRPLLAQHKLKVPTNRRKEMKVKKSIQAPSPHDSSSAANGDDVQTLASSGDVQLTTSSSFESSLSSLKNGQITAA
jgi:hypothetical protein